jgi:hypothetical protein
VTSETDDLPDVDAAGYPRWFSGAAFVLAAAAVACAIHTRDGEYWPSALKWVTVGLAFTLAGVALPHVRDSRGRGGTVLLAALAAALVFQFYQLLRSPPSGWNDWSNDLVDRRPENLRLYYAGVTSAAVLAAGLLLRDSRPMRNVCLPLLLGLHLCLGVWMIRSSPLPKIDVFAFQQIGAEALLAGKNPYTIEMPDIYHGTQQERDRAVYGQGLSEGGKLKFGFPYPPLSLYLSTIGYVAAGDHRYAQLLALTLAGALVAWSRPGRVAALAAVLLLFTPRAFFIIGRAWTEPFVVCMLAATVFCACRGLRVLPIALGLLLASKQYLVFALPAVFLLAPRERRGLIVLLGGAIATAALVSAPLVFWDLHAFVHSAGTVQKLAPFRTDALSYLVWMHNQWRTTPGVGLAFVAMAVGIVVAIWRSPRDASGFAGAMALTFLPFIAFNKQAFANYYLSVIGALCCAVAALPLVRKSEDASVR